MSRTDFTTRPRRTQVIVVHSLVRSDAGSFRIWHLISDPDASDCNVFFCYSGETHLLFRADPTHLWLRAGQCCAAQMLLLFRAHAHVVKADYATFYDFGVAPAF